MIGLGEGTGRIRGDSSVWNKNGGGADSAIFPRARTCKKRKKWVILVFGGVDGIRNEENFIVDLLRLKHGMVTQTAGD